MRNSVIAAAFALLTAFAAPAFAFEPESYTVDLDSGTARIERPDNNAKFVPAPVYKPANENAMHEGSPEPSYVHHDGMMHHAHHHHWVHHHHHHGVHHRHHHHGMRHHHHVHGLRHNHHHLVKHGVAKTAPHADKPAAAPAAPAAVAPAAK